MELFSEYTDEPTEVTTEPAGAAIETIRRIERELGITFPDDYVQFMQYSNGGTIEPGEGGWVILSPIEDLVSDRKIDFELYEGCVFFGSDGGLESYGFDIRTTPVTIVEVDRVAGMQSAIPMGHTLRELIYYARHKFDNLREEQEQ
jgi:hypothetical protein